MNLLQGERDFMNAPEVRWIFISDVLFITATATRYHGGWSGTSESPSENPVGERQLRCMWASAAGILLGTAVEHLDRLDAVLAPASDKETDDR